jgi:hypothetical protein
MTVRSRKSERGSGLPPWVSGAAIKYLRENDLPTYTNKMNTHYGIPAALVAQWESARAEMEGARAEWEADQCGETWDAYEETEDTYREVLYDILQEWLRAWRTEGIPAPVEAGLSEEEYEVAARRFRLRAELSRAIVDAYIVHDYGITALEPFYQDRVRVEAMAAECEVYVAARREQAAAEAERERLLVEWAKLPVAERKSSHPLFRARVDCCTRSEEARQRWFLSRLCRHELSVAARAMWMTMENQLYIIRQSSVPGRGPAVAAEIRRRCAEAGAIGAEVLRYARLDTVAA